MFNRSLDTAEDKLHELKDRLLEIIQPEHRIKKEEKQNRKEERSRT